ncbi:MAG TPA: DUF4365 domain-containing protein [Nitrososphaera sp.]|jgi:phosphatidylserine/phosphatidylglycerophosphate/cardiolipin synthase-like enzyme|nr:DUF4365 domain-containing protein [Nitrososphaera sp.]
MPKNRYSPIERIGVNAIERIILNDFEWIFREQIVVDMGIDAQVEVCENGFPTGRLIALQIKSGESWFRERTTLGVIYRGSLEHLDYWIAHSLPVILVLYNPNCDKAWWVLISNESIERTSSAWKVIMPFSQELNALAKDSIYPIAMPDYQKRRRLETIGSKLIQPSHLKADTSSFALLLSAINNAENSIYFVTPFLSYDLFLAFKSASYRAEVRGIISFEDERTKDAFADFRSEHPNIKLRFSSVKRGEPVLHSKFIVVDGSLAIYGSASLTSMAWRNERELILATMDTQIISSFTDEFLKYWSLMKAL